MENLGIDLKLLIAQIINFVLFFIVFQKFISKPFLSYLSKERKADEERKRALTLAKEEEERLLKLEQEVRLKAKKQADEMLEEAKKSAEHVREQIIAQAQKEAEQIIAKGKAAVDEEKINLYKDVKSKAVDLSMLIVKNALKDYLTEDAKKALSQHIVANASKEVN